MRAVQDQHLQPSQAPTGLTDSTNARESRLVWDYFQQQTHGTYIDVGANHPTERNQTWFLESQGWTGVLIEPIPELCDLLRAHRLRSRTVQAAVCGPGGEGEAELHVGADPAKSSLLPDWGHEMSGRRIRVPARTLNSILAEADIKTIDFLSLDVEGLELQVLSGLDLQRYQPQLILLEDHFYGYDKHFYLRRHGYKLVKRTGYNNWYVPRSAPVSVFSMCRPLELLQLGRKMWLATPFNGLRHRIKQRKMRAAAKSEK